MKAVVAAFNQEKALVGAFSVITNLRMELFQALALIHHLHRDPGAACLDVSCVAGITLYTHYIQEANTHNYIQCYTKLSYESRDEMKIKINFT